MTTRKNISVEIKTNNEESMISNEFMEEVLGAVISGDFDVYLTGNFNNTESKQIEEISGQNNYNIDELQDKNDEGDDAGEYDEPNEYDNIEDMMFTENTNSVGAVNELNNMRYFTCSLCKLISKNVGKMVIEECGHTFCKACLDSFFYEWDLNCLVMDCDSELSEQNIRLLFQMMKEVMRKEKQRKKKQEKDESCVDVMADADNQLERYTEEIFVSLEPPLQPVVSNLNNFSDDLQIISNQIEFECKICFTVCQPYEGIILRACLHSFCIECMREFFRNDENILFECPNVDNKKCNKSIEEREIRSILPEKEFRNYMRRIDKYNFLTVKGSIQCCETNCTGICIIEKGDTSFLCPKCSAVNCLSCKAIHDDITCDEYKIIIDPALGLNIEYLKQRKAKGLAMDCTCGATVEKIIGCDGMKCTICKTDLCWATKGPRWGPGGKDDKSGGCHCSLLKRCHPSCKGCH